MANYHDQYKVKNGFGSVENNRLFRAKINEIKRKGQRATDFAKNRELQINDDTTNTGTKEKRYLRLLQWKAERERRKKMEEIKKKPAFKVGVVHHNYYSPPIKDNVPFNRTKTNLHNHKQVTKPESPLPKRITRATQKRLLKKLEVPKELPQKQIAGGKKKELFSDKKKIVNPVKGEPSFAPKNHKFTAPSGLKSVPLFGRVTMLHTPVKAPVSRSASKKKSSISEITVEPLNSNKNVKAENENDNVPSIDTMNDSPEAITLKLSSDENDASFNGLIEEAEFLRNSTFSNSSHSRIITTPGNISAIVDDNKPLMEDKNKSKKEVKKTSPQSTNDIEEKTTPSLKNTSMRFSEVSTPKDPAFFSPYVVTSRGKSNARKEQQIRHGIGCSPCNDIPTKETVMKTLNISIEEEERTAQYFTFMLNKEINRLNELCDKWSEIQLEPDIPEDAQYRINQAIGQTRLLINKKFERFRGLVSDCETGKGEMLVTCRDLQGFWDMMYMEVTNCDTRFEVLNKLRTEGWKEEEIAVTKVTHKKKRVTKKKVVPKKQSSVKNFILAAKKKLQNNTGNVETLEDQMSSSINKLSTSINNIDIEAGENKILKKKDARQSKSLSSKDRLSVPNARQSLLQRTLLSESCKAIKTPITIMKISQMCKTPKIELDESISYINCKQTPSKSILKKIDEYAEARLTKSIQKVNFDDQVVLNEVSVDEEVQNKLDLAAKLARIEDLDLDAEYTDNNIRAEKKLDFNDDSFINLKSNLQNDNEQSSIPDEANKKHDSNVETQIVEKAPSESEDETTKNTNTRTLRNRVVVTNDSEKKMSIRRKSIKGLNNEDNDQQKENKNPAKSKKGSSRISKRVEEEKEITEKEIGHIITPVNVKQELRRSTRKSVRFNAEDCTICTEQKPVHPMTPHTRRSKGRITLSFLQGNNTIIQTPSPNTDLIKWDTPQVPARVRRSSRYSNKHSS